ncbi:FAD-binding dehydrogenase [Natronoglycomyces albus]|uniref:FAD-binding dehydrogenase n=1 Tax=Natronoglycomyces albus TaxID=2811108 RepID=A0A895XVC7_9ACTN|nr:FAD-binding dehydrogenase [Natronoglycomyces albus]QSB06476.1 FAD-binding dehydrogenase [Natronoglycomyces albus]
MQTDVIVVGTGLAGLVATTELVRAGKTVTLVEQEPENSLGGQAFWSFGGLFLVDSPEQRRMGIRDSTALAWQDWQGSAGFDRDVDAWPRRWAEGYVDFAAGEKRAWLRSLGVRFFPVVGWAERGGYLASGHGNSVPRFHIVWGTGPTLVEAFAAQVRDAAASGQVKLAFRHQVDELVLSGPAVTGVRGSILERSKVSRGVPSSRVVVGEFDFSAESVVVASGGMGGNVDLVRRNWPKRLGSAPKHMLSGVPAHVDGRMLHIAQAAGGQLINSDRMWHYTEGITNWDPIWPQHGIRILPGPSSLWLDARGRRLPAPLFPGFDTLGTLEYIMHTGFEHTWFVLTQKILEREFALSGSEQNPDLTGKSLRQLLKRLGPGAPAPVAAFTDHGADFVVAEELDDLVRQMNSLTAEPLLEANAVRQTLEARDREVANVFGKDLQIMAMRQARRYRGDKYVRVAKPHRLLDPKAGPLIGVKLNILTRKTLGGLHTNLHGQVLDAQGNIVPGLYAAGEVAGFGGGGMHGYRSLEGTFLGGCLYSGRRVGQAIAQIL